MGTRILLFLVLSLSLSQAGRSQSDQKANVLFLIADDWSQGHAGILGDRVVRTPNIDAVAKAGAVFRNAFAAAPSCTPSRAAVLTGKFPHELEAGASLWGYLPKKFATYTHLLAEAGYHVGSSGKGWGPGNFREGGYEFNPAGRSFENFEAFLRNRPQGKPFSFWFGSQNPHRPYEAGSGAASGMDAGNVDVPRWLPDVTEVRHDILDYYYEVEQFDRQVGEILSLLKARGEYDNTLIIITGDNGMPFPRAKANLYDAGTSVPLIISMTGKIRPQQNDALVSLTDIAPTILELCGEVVPQDMTGESLWPVLRGESRAREAAFTERERHANVRDAELGYPCRAIRTKDFLYIVNYEPDRWPAGDPRLYHSVGPYGDVDASPSKEYILNHANSPDVAPFFTASFAKRSGEELYDLRIDPGQMSNVAGEKKYEQDLSRLRSALRAWQVSTADPRAVGQKVMFDEYPYFGPPIKGAPSTYMPALKR